WCRDSQQWLVGKHCSSFRHSPDITCEFESGEIIEKLLAYIFERRVATYVINLFTSKLQTMQIIKNLFKSRGDEIGARFRQCTNKHFKRSLFLPQSIIEKGCCHRYLIQ